MKLRNHQYISFSEITKTYVKLNLKQVHNIYIYKVYILC